MATEFGEVRAWTRLLIPELIRMNISPTSYYNKMVNIGGFYRKQTFLSDFREFNGLMKKEKAVRSTRVDSFLKKGNMVEIDMDRERKYRVIAEMERVDPVTGNPVTTIESFYSDENKLFSEWLDDYEDFMVTKDYKQDSPISNMTVIGVLHNKDKGY